MVKSRLMAASALVACTVACAVALPAHAEFAPGNQIGIVGASWSVTGAQTDWGGGYYTLGSEASYQTSAGAPWFVTINSWVVNPYTVTFSVDFSHYDLADASFFVLDLSGLKSDGTVVSVSASQGFSFVWEDGNGIGWDCNGDGIRQDPKVFITVEQVPGPGSLAILGTIGLIGPRRRRLR
jgi:hypothetical protein